VWRDAAVILGRDLRIERRSRVVTNQVLPFALLVLMLFAFALDPDRGVLARASAGLFWVAVLFSALLAIQRSFALEACFALEASDEARDGLRLSGLDPAGIFLGKALAVAVQLVLLELVLTVGVVVLYGSDLDGPVLLAVTCLLATAGLAAAGTVYGVIAAGLRVRETLLPLLVLPVMAPVLLAATRAWEAGLAGVPGEGWSWLRILGVFAVVYIAVGIAAFGALLEDA
jgi:heme exporter protein B